MSDCDCATLRAGIEELLHNELCAEESAPLRKHLEECPDCQNEEAALTRLTQAVRRACEDKAPTSLRDAIAAGLREVQDDDHFKSSPATSQG
ncbi:MAG: alpha-ketoglutarate decarboxylase [Canibacter sp.]